MCRKKWKSEEFVINIQCIREVFYSVRFSCLCSVFFVINYTDIKISHYLLNFSLTLALLSQMLKRQIVRRAAVYCCENMTHLLFNFSTYSSKRLIMWLWLQLASRRTLSIFWFHKNTLFYLFLFKLKIFSSFFNSSGNQDKLCVEKMNELRVCDKYLVYERSVVLYYVVECQWDFHVCVLFFFRY